MNWILKRLRRITLTTAYLPEIDGVRFIAITAVVLCHVATDLVLRHGLQVQSYAQGLYTTLSHGARGVHLFFTISGFILAIPFARRFLAGSGRPDLKRYFRRRLFRLEPPYLLSVVIITITTWVIVPTTRPFLIWHLLASVTYSHLAVFHYSNPVNIVWWSLEIETQFYILMPLLALVFKIRHAWLRRGLLALGALTSFSWQGAAHSWIVDMTILGSIQFFLVGLLAADIHQSGVLRRKRSTVWDVLGTLSVVTLFVLPGWWHIAAPVLTFLIVTAALNGSLFRNFLSLPWISAIGSMCYTIYLWHLFVIGAVLKISLKLLMAEKFLLSMVTQAAIVLPIIFFFSVVLFLAIEKPCMEPEWPTSLRNFLRDFLKGSPIPNSVAEME